MKIFFGIIILFPLFLFSQEKEKKAFRRHFIEISPVTVTLKKGFSYSQRLEYRFLITQNLYLKAGSTATLFRQLDYSRKNSEYGIRPLFNESSIAFGFQKPFNQLTETNRKVNLVGVDLGYHYMQYSVSPQSGSYEIVDSTENGFRKSGGYRIHSLKAGLSFQHITYTDETIRPAVKFRHFLSLSFLYGLGSQLPTYILLSPGSASKYKDLNGYGWKNQFGGKIEYTFEHLVSKRIGILYGTSFTWAPWADYQPNYNYFVPRGGHTILPAAFTVRVGITIQ